MRQGGDSGDAAAIVDWEAGVPCARHDMAFCGGCRELSGIERRRDGSLGLRADCAVATFSELTGAPYDVALAAMRAVGFGVGRGTSVARIPDAFAAAGWLVVPVAMNMDEALNCSAFGRKFYVIGTRGGRTVSGLKGHAWSIVGGRVLRPWTGPFKFRIFEVLRSGSAAAGWESGAGV